MIYMITGGYNAGKTRRLTSICCEKKKIANRIGGFISEKIMMNEVAIGYALRNITNNRRILLACDASHMSEIMHLKNNQDILEPVISREQLIGQFSDEIDRGLEVHFNEYYLHDRFIFCKDAFNYANTLISNLSLSNEIDEIFIDEVGKIELLGDGYFIGLISAVRSQKTVYLCVHDSYVKDVIDLIESIHHTFGYSI